MNRWYFLKVPYVEQTFVKLKVLPYAKKYFPKRIQVGYACERFKPPRKTVYQTTSSIYILEYMLQFENISSAK